MTLTDSQVNALAKATRIQNYCEQYNEGIDDPTYHCEEEGCPLYFNGLCKEKQYIKGFLDCYNVFVRM